MEYGAAYHGDKWRMRDGYRACEYCGSMHPDDLFAAIEAGAQISGTDKNYKIYVSPAHPDPEGTKIISGSDRKPDWGKGWVEVTDEHRELMKAQGWRGDYKWIMLGTNGPTAFAKFYFEHFDTDAQIRFINLYNEKKINLEPQFGLYVAPFFMRFAPKGQSQ